jgi:4-hydroxyproline epimerase
MISMRGGKFASTSAELPPGAIRVVDTHTGGEPTRIIVAGGPELGHGPLEMRRQAFRERFDHVRSAVVNEPRGSDVMVGALLTEPTDPKASGGVIFFNNVGYLGMCGHGTIGVAVALHHLGRIEIGKHVLETPVGPVGFQLHGQGRVTIENVPSYRFRAGVTVSVPDVGDVKGDVAWGGNWFFLAERSPVLVEPGNIPSLTDIAWRIRRALTDANITGEDGGEIDHIELFGPPANSINHSRSFVLCPGGAYDRSPCGTGTSAKLACLHAAGKLKPGDIWRQESIIGSVFEGSVAVQGDQVIPMITGSAYVNGEATLLFDANDPFQWGIRPM